MQLYTINTGFFKLDGGAMFGVVPKSLWNKLNPPDSHNMCTWALRCLLIEDGKKLILIDNGIGNKQNEKFLSHFSPFGEDTIDTSLAALGFSRDDITDVLLTHLHFDHCGGSIQWNKDRTGYEPAFKNAIYWSHEKHWQWAINPNERELASFLKENILPIKESGQLKLVGESFSGIKKSTDIANNKFPLLQIGDLGLSVMVVSGHTECMMLPHIEYKGKTLVYVADLFPSHWHIPLPYIMAYDIRPLLTLDEKKNLLKNAVDKNYTFFFEHDPAIECCNLQNTERGIKTKDSFSLNEFC